MRRTAVTGLLVPVALALLVGACTSDDTGGAIDVPTTVPPSTEPIVTVPTDDLAREAASACGAAEPGQATLVTTLRGSEEIPVPGAPGALGTAAVAIGAERGTVGYALHVAGADPAVGAHVHEGRRGSAGPPVVTLTAPDADGRAVGCARVSPALTGRIAANPDAYYVNVHTGRFPDGAVRGQLEIR